ncbi:glycosyl hydrolase catalytic core-domain-containing protein [Multifurca ochricompacta]|uniref:Glycosyl hydrolase catalytic core-domain-containing protein n=1 Tax=Multifurca ochricompacta TaxID=376703 RepID=A0AAD4M4J7_9AGAM|nr:glycosyl hydrolase catalytic core-domain-containing protein [Multifurca ochricompacta]
MAPVKYLNIFTVFSLTILTISLNTLPSNALAVERDHIGRSFNHAHADIAKKKRTPSSKRCKPRPSDGSLPGSASSSTPSDTSDHHSTSHTSSTPEPTTPYTSPVIVPTTSKPPQATTTTTTTTTPSKAPVVSTPTSSGNGKVGLAWSNGEQGALPKFKSAHTKYVYNWKLERYTDVNPEEHGFEFIPMVWGVKDVFQIKNVLLPGYAKIVFGFNEPDQGGQSNLDVYYAVQLWKQYIDPLKYLGYELISPACTNSADGFTWIKTFMANCDTCSISAMAFHYYDTDPDRFIAYTNTFHDTFGRDVWVTEFAAQDFSGRNQQANFQEIQGFIGKTAAFMNSVPWVIAYFYFEQQCQQLKCSYGS